MAGDSAAFDLVVVGGGINGAGIARDAAMRGLSVLLLEKEDFCSGTSAGSSRLIHGGLRYLEYGEIPLVFESLHERRRLREIASHLVKPIRVNIPIYESSRRGNLLVRLGMFAYDVLSLGKKMPRHRMLSADGLQKSCPGINVNGLRGAAQYYDAQVTFAERLVIENLIGARNAGADIRNYSPVIGITVHRRRVKSVEFVDRVSGEEREVRARIVINAAGPWVDRVLATVNREMKPYMGGTKGSHIIVGDFPGAPGDAIYVEAATDGRPIFIIPWNNQYLIGTTDIRYSGDPADAVATREEVDYLLAETNRVFPTAELSVENIHYAYSAIRPLPRKEAGPESAITRKHIIKKHRRQAGGLVSIIGGKLTTYRNLAEQATDYACRSLRRQDIECQTGSTPLPGAARLNRAQRRLAEFGGLSEQGRERLLATYGGRAAEIIELASSERRLARTLDGGRTVLEAEVVFAIREEMALNLTDIIYRRMMVGFWPDQGQEVATAIADVAAGELGWSRKETDRQLELLQEHNRRRIPARSLAATD